MISNISFLLQGHFDHGSGNYESFKEQIQTEFCTEQAGVTFRCKKFTLLCLSISLLFQKFTTAVFFWLLKLLEVALTSSGKLLKNILTYDMTEKHIDDIWHTNILMI